MDALFANVDANDGWYGVYIQGTKSGYAHIQLKDLRESDSPTVEMEMNMVLETKVGDDVLQITNSHIEQFDGVPPYRLLRSATVTKSRDEVEKIEIEQASSGNNYNVRIEQGGANRTEKFDADYTLLDASRSTLWVLGGPEVGDTCEQKSLDVTRLAISSDHYRIKEKKRGRFNGVEISYYVIATTIGEMAFDMVTLEDGTPVKMVMGEAFEMRLEAENVAKALDRPRDLFVDNVVPAEGNFVAPSFISEMSIEVDALLGRTLSNGPGQRVLYQPERETYLVTITSKNTEDIAVTEAERQDALEHNIDFPAKVPKVVELALRAVGDAESRSDKVAKLVNFVNTYLDYDYSAEPLTVLDIIKRQEGDCSEFSALFTTLARALDIPARVVFGLIYTGEQSFGGHAWNEVEIGGYWVPVDATWREVVTNASHIRLGVGEGLELFTGLKKSRIRLLEASVDAAAARRLATEGDQEAQLTLGFLHYHGLPGVVEDKVEAEKWLRKAGEQGHSVAQSGLRSLFSQAITLDVEGRSTTIYQAAETAELEYFYLTSSGAFSIDEIRIGRTYDSVTGENKGSIFYDGFDYPVGTRLKGQGTWWSDRLPRHVSAGTDTYTVSEGSLFGGGLLPSGNMLTAKATSSISGIAFDIPSDALISREDDIYIGFLVRPEGIIGEGIWGGYFGVGVKFRNQKGILFGKPGNSSAPNDKSYAVDQQGGPILKTTGARLEVGKTSLLVARLERTKPTKPGLNTSEDVTGEEISPSVLKTADTKTPPAPGSLGENIIGKIVTFKIPEAQVTHQVQFNGDGTLLILGRSERLEYRIETNEVLMFDEGKRGGGISFESSSPQVGHRAEMGAGEEMVAAIITKIENEEDHGGRIIGYWAMDPQKTLKVLESFPDSEGLEERRQEVAKMGKTLSMIAEISKGGRMVLYSGEDSPETMTYTIAADDDKGTSGWIRDIRAGFKVTGDTLQIFSAERSPSYLTVLASRITEEEARRRIGESQRKSSKEATD